MQNELKGKPGIMGCYLSKIIGAAFTRQEKVETKLAVLRVLAFWRSNYCKSSHGTNPPSAQRSKCFIRLRDYKISGRLVKVIPKF